MNRAIRLSCTTWAASMALAVTTLSADAATPAEADPWSNSAMERRAALADAENNRGAIVSGIIERMRPEAEDGGFVGWERELSALLSGTTVKRLLAAQEAGTYKAVVSAAMGTSRESIALLSGAATAFDSSAGGVLAVGDEPGASFKPIAPCRIIDTRLATGGALAASSIRPFHIDDSAVPGVVASQGGDCTLTAPAGTVGVVINLTATQQTQRGFMTVFPFGEPFPAAGSSINYTPGTNLANTTTVGTAVAAGADFNIYTLQNVHAVVDLLGYFVASDTLRVEANTTSSGSFDIVTDECPVGYQYTGAEFSWGLGNTGVWMTGVAQTQAANPADPDPESARCRGNVTSGSQSIFCYAVCQR